MRGRAVAARLAVTAACVAFAGLVALPFVGNGGEPTELLAGAPPPSTTTTTSAPPPVEPVLVPTTAAVPPPPPPAPVPVEAPPIVVDDPAAGVGDVAAPAEDPDAGAAVAVPAPPATAPPPVATAPPPAAPVVEARADAPTVVPHPERLWVVSIGIDDYPGRRFDLGAARADAITVTDTMAGLGVPADHIYELLDDEATVTGILAAVEWAVTNAGPLDTVVFFYAGHVRDVGGGTEVLVATDGWVADWFLAERFAGLRADDAWFAIAGCYGGGFQELLGPGRILTGAADPGELAYESAGYGRSYMVEFLFQRAIADGQAPVPTVQAAVAWANAELAARHPDHTLWHGDQSGHLVSLDGADRNTPASAPPPPSEPPPTTAPPPERCLLGLLCG